MKLFKQLLLILFVVFYSTSGICDHKVGFTPKFCLFSIDDPNGDTQMYSGLQAASLSYIVDIDRRSRLYSDATMIDFDIPASSSEVANTVKGYAITTAYQRILRLTRDIQFYAGLGLTMSQLDFTDRYIETESGYLAESYEDRSETSFAVYLNISTEWEIKENFDFGVNIGYQQDLGDSVSGLCAGLSLFYRFGR